MQSRQTDDPKEEKTATPENFQSVFSNPAFIRCSLFPFLTAVDRFSVSQINTTLNKAFTDAAVGEEQKQDLKAIQNKANRTCPPLIRRKR